MPVQLQVDHPQVLGARRDLELEQALDAADERLHVEEVGEVVHPLHERDHLPVGLVLAVLLDPGVDVAHDRLQVADDLALEADQQPQHPVRGGVVRPHVDRHQLLLGLERLAGGGPLHGRAADHLGLGARDDVSAQVRSFEPPRDFALVAGEDHRLAAHREVAALRPADVVLGHQDPPQVGMAAEDDPEEVVDLALVELGGGEERDAAVDLRQLRRRRGRRARRGPAAARPAACSAARRRRRSAARRAGSRRRGGWRGSGTPGPGVSRSQPSTSRIRSGSTIRQAWPCSW